MRAPARRSRHGHARAASCSSAGRPSSSSLAGRLAASRTSSRPVFREKGKADRDAALDRRAPVRPTSGRGRRAAALLVRRDARVRVRPRPRRPDEPLDPRARRARRDPRLGRGHPVVARTGRRCSCSPPTSAPTAQARRRATKISEAGGGGPDPKVYPARARHWRRLYLVDAESGETREVQPEGVNVFEFGWAGGKVAAVCTDEPSESAWYDAWIGLIDIEARTRRARPHARVAAAVPAHLARRAGRVDRGLRVRSRGRDRHGARPRRRPARARARRHVDRVRRRGDALVRGLARRRLDVRPARPRRRRIDERSPATSLFGARFQPRVTPQRGRLERRRRLRVGGRAARDRRSSRTARRAS